MKRIVSFVLSLNLMLTTPTYGALLSDVHDHWAEVSINNLTTQQVVNGIEGQFKPNELVTRAQFAKLLITALNNQDEMGMANAVPSSFRDVASNHWAKGYIELAKEKAIITGDGQGLFRPEAPITRAEIAAIIVRTLGLDDNDQALEDKLFTDSDQFPQWAQPFITKAYTHGLIGGYEDGSFQPKRLASRAEATVLIERLLARLGKQYMFGGRLIGFDPVKQVMSVNVNGSPKNFGLATGLKIYEGRRLTSIDRLVPGEQVYFNTDIKGRVNYVAVGNGAGAEPEEPRVVWKDRVVFASAVGGVQEEKANTEGAKWGQLLEGPQEQEADKPGNSLEVTKAEMGVQDFVKTTGARGDDVTIAIIDTGVDPAHFDLFAVPNGDRKLISWKDFTNEGLVYTKPYGHKGSIGAAKSLSGVYRVGVLDEAKLASKDGEGQDLNLNGTTTDKIPMLLADSKKAHVYDTVFVDTNLDNSFVGEKRLGDFDKTGESTTFPATENGLARGFAVVGLNADGTAVRLGFDVHGHGTHVAGIAAGNGEVTGVAPGAKLMVLKAVDSDGSTSWTNVSKAIKYAAEHGADIVNLSLGFDGADGQGDSAANYLVNKMIEQYGTHFVVAAGNNGPGLTTVTTPADTMEVVSVGAYISPKMWKQDYGWDVGQETLWFFSSLGPRGDGGFVPSVIAPGSAISTYTAGKYYLSEGTSMAAPHVTGAIALLLGEAREKKLKVTPAQMKAAIEQGARPISSFSAVEQGHGVVNLKGAWEKLQRQETLPQFISKVYHSYMKSGSGLYGRGFEPGQVNFSVTNLENKNVRLNLTSDQKWLTPVQNNITFPAIGQRTIGVEYSLDGTPGLKAGLVKGKVPGQQGTALELLTTVIKPNYFDTQELGFDNQTLKAGQFKRYFLAVPEGAQQLKLDLQAESTQSGNYLGRVRMHLYDPFGKEINPDPTDFAGVDPDGKGKSKTFKQVDQPAAGIWEVVVYSSATLAEYNLTNSRYNLKAALTGGQVNGSYSGQGILYAAALPIVVTEGKDTYVTFQVRKAGDLTPYEGHVFINERLYSVKNGQVTIKVATEQISDDWVFSFQEAY